jgi:hypothetical protein
MRLVQLYFFAPVFFVGVFFGIFECLLLYIVVLIEQGYCVTLSMVSCEVCDCVVILRTKELLCPFVLKAGC